VPSEAEISGDDEDVEAMKERKMFYQAEMPAFIVIIVE
jgi:hypothetical protein